MDRGNWTVSEVMQLLLCGEETDELQNKALDRKRSMSYGRETWIMTKRMRFQMQVAKMSFLQRVAGLKR